jgi:hypothetical protein
MRTCSEYYTALSIRAVSVTVDTMALGRSRARKTVFLSGACGAGKTSAMRLMRRHLLLVLGEVAVIIKTPEWIDAHVRYMRGHYEAWTARVNYTALSPDETVQAILDVVLSNRGRLTQSFPL